MKKNLYSYFTLMILLLPFQMLRAQELVNIFVADKNVIVVVVETSGLVIYDDASGVSIPSQNSSGWQVNGANPVEVGRYTYVWYQSRKLNDQGGRYDMTLRHQMYLKLPADLVNGTTYTVTSPESNSISLTFSDESTFCEAIKVNQVGYFGGSEKRYANMGIYLGDLGTRLLTPVPTFKVLNSDDVTVMSGVLQYYSLFDESGEHLYQMDLSPLPDGGPYRISVSGYGVSHPFGVGIDYVEESDYVHFKGLYHQRCGMALEEPYTTFTRPTCHGTVEVTDANPPGMITDRGPERSITGGYHDAGDFDRRPSHTMIPVWMLSIFEAYPDAFSDNQYNLPESGNGVPDWLDECLWGIKIWEELQEPDGAIRAGTEAQGHPPFGIPAHEDSFIYRTYRKYGHTTASGAGMFAHASRLLHPYDPARAAELLDKAILSWEYLQENSHPTANHSQMMYAALQLYLATEDQVYHTEFKNHLRAGWNSQYSPRTFNLNTIANGQLFESYFFGYLLTDLPTTQSLKDSLVSRVTTMGNQVVTAVNNQPYPMGNVPNLAWGTATSSGRYAMPLMLLYRLNESQEYLNVISQLGDYTLGLNPLNRSYVTGLGANPPNNICHADSYYQYHKGKGNVPGIVVYGPCEALSGANYQRLVYERLYPAISDLPKQRKYSDGWTWIGATEFTTWETQVLNACMYGFLGALSGFAPPPPDNPPLAPSELVVTATSHKVVELSWADNSTDESGFRIERKEGETGSYLDINTVNRNTTEYIDTKRTPLTTYYYRVRALNSAGNSDYSNESSVTTPDLPPPPVAPSNLTVGLVTNNQVELSWDDNSGNEEGFILERKTGVDGTYHPVVDLDPDTETYINTGLGSSTIYYYRVKAYNDGGHSTYSNEVSAETLEASLYYSIDINTPSEGSTSDSAGVITVVGYGSKIWGDDDGFRYVYQEDLTGNLTITAKVESNVGSAAQGVAGVMIRQELVNNSKFMGIFMQQDGRIRSIRRDNTGSSQWASPDFIDPEGSPTGFPVWLKLQKEGNVITTYSSTDGTTWTQRAERTLTFEEGFYMGLALTAWSGSASATAEFSEVGWPSAGPSPTERFTINTSAENGTITLNPMGGEYESGQQVQVTAVPDTGYEFVTWSGDLSGSANPTTIIMDADKTIAATFIADTLVETYTLTTSAENGIIVMNPVGGVYITGAGVQVTAVPNSGYVFEGWSGDLSGSDNPTIITMDGDKTITATFITDTLVDTYTLTTSAENGIIEINPVGGVYIAGEEVQITAVPDSGYIFNAWSGDLSGSENPTTITMDSDKAITATFMTATQVETFTLTASAENGLIELSPAGGEYETGVEVQVTAIPASGYEFEGWGGDLSGTTNPMSITMDGNKAITASFIETSTSVALIDTNPTGFSMDIYPNPFSISTNISLQLEATSDIDIQIFDVTGRLVWRTQESNLTEGNHTFVWSAEELSSIRSVGGVFFCQVRVVMPGGTHVKSKIIMMK